MVGNRDLPAASMMDLGARELAAFLRAVVDVAGQSVLPSAGDVWIEVMEDVAWPDNNFEKYFRRITIRAAARLAKMSSAGKNNATTW